MVWQGFMSLTELDKRSKQHFPLNAVLAESLKPSAEVGFRSLWVTRMAMQNTQEVLCRSWSFKRCLRIQRHGPGHIERIAISICLPSESCDLVSLFWKLEILRPLSLLSKPPLSGRELWTRADITTLELYLEFLWVLVSSCLRLPSLAIASACNVLCADLNLQPLRGCKLQATWLAKAKFCCHVPSIHALLFGCFVRIASITSWTNWMAYRTQQVEPTCRPTGYRKLSYVMIQSRGKKVYLCGVLALMPPGAGFWACLQTSNPVSK